MSLREHGAILAAWRAAGRDVAVATVTATWGSAPRPVGSTMVVAAPSEPGAFPDFEGSVSGGCVEAAVIDAAQEVLSGGAARLLRFGVSDAEARAVGLACGGRIEAWLEPLDERADRRLWREAAITGYGARRLLVHEGSFEVPAGRARTVAREAGGRVFAGTLGSAAMDAAADVLLGRHPVSDPPPAASPPEERAFPDATEQAGEALADLRFQILHDEASGPLILVGAGHIAQHLAPIASRLGFEVVVVDPRAAFLAAARFPNSRTVHAWPDRDTLRDTGLAEGAYVVTLAHDPKIDDLALRAALSAGARYVGALGSRASHAERIERLRGAGVGEAALAKIRGPVGLDIGARTAAEIALAISAELIAVRRGAR